MRGRQYSQDSGPVTVRVDSLPGTGLPYCRINRIARLAVICYETVSFFPAFGVRVCLSVMTTSIPGVRQIAGSAYPAAPTCILTLRDAPYLIVRCSRSQAPSRHLHQGSRGPWTLLRINSQSGFSFTRTARQRIPRLPRSKEDRSSGRSVISQCSQRAISPT